MEPVPSSKLLQSVTEAGGAEVVLVASAFGVDTIRRDGHAAWVEKAGQAGAAGFEVRRELFGSDAEVRPEALAHLGRAIATHHMWAVYSVPDALYHDDGTLDDAALRAALAQADALGARFVKLQLGGFAGRAHGVDLRRATSGAAARVLVENGQLPAGGSLGQFVGLFEALAREQAAGALGMTFDIGNWQWVGVAPLEAAKALASKIEYVHCKAVAGEGARRFAVAPAADDPLCRAVFSLVSRGVPRGIEFPLDANDTAADAQRRVAWLAAL
jgi:sugar phosphate isomerase/epimerase